MADVPDTPGTPNIPDTSNIPNDWVGIDHGTGNSAAFCNGQLIQYDHGRQGLPSIVRYSQGLFSMADGPAEAGDSDFKFYKRILGCSNSAGNLGHDLDIVPFAKRDPNGSDVILCIGDEYFHPEEIAAFLIGSLLRAAQTIFPACRNAVIAVPAHFSKTQIRATQDAARMAGAEQVKIIPEPVAVVVHLLRAGAPGDAEFVLVVDGGAGTWDLSAVTYGEAGAKRRFTVKATAGNNALGGLDVDKALRDIVIRKAERAVISTSLLEKCEKAKIRMSKQPQVEPSITVPCDEGTSVTVKLTRDDFDQACSWLRSGIDALFRELFRRDATMKERIEVIALNGGSSYLPCVRDVCRDHLPGKRIIQQEGDTAVASGASLFGSDPSIEVMDVLPQSIGIRAIKKNEIVIKQILQRNKQLPADGTTVVYLKYDHQEKLALSLYEGEHVDFRKCTPLGQVCISGTSSCKKGTPIEVTIHVTMENVVRARAVIEGHEGNLTVDLTSKFDSDQIEVLQSATETRLDGVEARGQPVERDLRDNCSYISISDDEEHESEESEEGEERKRVLEDDGEDEHTTKKVKLGR